MVISGRHPTTKHIGHVPGQPHQSVHPCDYYKLAAMEDEGWGYGAIGKMFSISGTTASRLIRKYRAGILKQPSQDILDMERDLAEVRAYLSIHPNARYFDVMLECHMGERQAGRLIRKIRGNND